MALNLPLPALRPYLISMALRIYRCRLRAAFKHSSAILTNATVPGGGRWALAARLSHETRQGKAATGRQEVQSALAILQLGPSPDPPGPSSQPVFQPAPRTPAIAPRAPAGLNCLPSLLPDGPPSLPAAPLTPAATELFPSQFTVPDAELCQKWLFLQPSDLLRAPVVTQRHLPKSCSHLVANVLAWLCAQVHDPQLSAAQREASLLLVVLAPRWLWPAPKRVGAAPLPAHARPNLIRARARHVQAYLTGQLGTTAWDLFNASSLIPRAKDAAGSGVRPIAMPSLWRKLAGLLILHKWRAPLTRAMGSHQFGAMRSTFETT